MIKFVYNWMQYGCMWFYLMNHFVSLSHLSFFPPSFHFFCFLLFLLDMNTIITAFSVQSVNADCAQPQLTIQRPEWTRRQSLLLVFPFNGHRVNADGPCLSVNPSTAGVYTQMASQFSLAANVSNRIINTSPSQASFRFIGREIDDLTHRRLALTTFVSSPQHQTWSAMSIVILFVHT